MKAVTKNSCNLCAPLGAVVAFKGVENSISLLHGSQGCATYIRRYLISHYREPIDTASSSFTEETAVFGGGENLKAAILNVMRQYHPEVIGIASTCLSETIGDNVPMILNEFRKELEKDSPGTVLPKLIAVSTPSYSGNQIEGFIHTVRETVRGFAKKSGKGHHINLFPSMVSPADLRYLKRLIQGMGIECILFPDYEKTLDGGIWGEYQPIPPGGTTAASLEQTGSAKVTIEFVGENDKLVTAGDALQQEHAVPARRTPLPIGVELTDRFLDLLQEYTERSIPAGEISARERLIDAYTDGHKYLFGKRVLLYGDEDVVVSLYTFMQEIGTIPVICASGGRTGSMRAGIIAHPDYHDLDEKPVIQDGADFEDIEELAGSSDIDLMIGSGKGAKIARKLDIPLIRVGFPIHDRFGASRIRMIGYEGTLELYDRIVNAVMETMQKGNPIGYSYI